MGHGHAVAEMAGPCLVTWFFFILRMASPENRGPAYLDIEMGRHPNTEDGPHHLRMRRASQDRGWAVPASCDAPPHLGPSGQTASSYLGAKGLQRPKAPIQLASAWVCMVAPATC